MALDRTWYNTLVNDSGTGLDGSVWDKEDVDALMDAVDAEIARIEPRAGGWTPRLKSSAGGTATYSVQRGTWALSGFNVTIGGRITLSNKGSLAEGIVLIADLPFLSYAGCETAGPAIPFFGGLIGPISSLGTFLFADTTDAYLHIIGAPGIASEYLFVSQISNTFDIIFGGTYRIK